MLGLVWPYEIRRKYRHTYTGSNAFSSPVPLGLSRLRDHKETMCFRNENGKDVIQSRKSFLEPDRHFHTPKATFPFHLNYTKKKQNTLRPSLRSMRLEVVGESENGRARGGHSRGEGAPARKAPENRFQLALCECGYFQLVERLPRKKLTARGEKTVNQ